MIIGVGIDLVSIDRIDKVYKKYPDRFSERIFTNQEKINFEQRGSLIAVLAARFAAKEAVLKAIGCGIGPAALNEVELTALPGQQPRVKLSGEASRLAGERNITAVSISMTHEPPFACAMAVAFSVPDESS